jgi:hypothetical protein
MVVPYRALIVRHFLQIDATSINGSIALAAIETLKRKLSEREWKLLLAAAFVNPSVAKRLDDFDVDFQAINYPESTIIEVCWKHWNNLFGKIKAESCFRGLVDRHFPASNQANPPPPKKSKFDSSRSREDQTGPPLDGELRVYSSICDGIKEAPENLTCLNSGPITRR